MSCGDEFPWPGGRQVHAGFGFMISCALYLCSCSLMQCILVPLCMFYSVSLFRYACCNASRSLYACCNVSLFLYACCNVSLFLHA